jgi:hypothetical protein
MEVAKAQNLAAEPQGKNRSHRRRCEYSIKIALREIGWAAIDWIHLAEDPREIRWDVVDWMDMAQDRDQRRALVKTLVILRVPIILGIS